LKKDGTNQWSSTMLSLVAEKEKFIVVLNANKDVIG